MRSFGNYAHYALTTPFAMRMDNYGEGGILALMALIGIERGRRFAIIAIGLFGAALIYGDGAITPAIALESMRREDYVVIDIGGKVDAMMATADAHHNCRPYSICVKPHPDRAQLDPRHQAPGLSSGCWT